MKLARKITLAVALAVIAILSLYGYLGAGREIELFDSDMRRDHVVLGRALASAVADVWRRNGEDSAVQLITNARREEDSIGLRWIRGDADAGIPEAARAALDRGEAVHIEEKNARGPGRLVTYVPVRAGAVSAAIELAESLADQQRYVRDTVRRTGVIMAALALACGALTTLLGLWFVGRPMRALVEQARRVGSGNFTGRLDLRQRDEIGELALEMNAMCGKLADSEARIAAEASRRIATLEQLRHADRLATVGKLASGIAHELGTPLNVIHARAKLIAGDDAVGAKIARGASVIAEQAERMTRIIRELLDFARRREPKRQRCDLAALARGTLDMLRPLASKSRVKLDADVDTCNEGASFPADVDGVQIQQVITNLAVNAIQATPEGGSVTVSVTCGRASPPPDAAARPGDSGDYVRIDVRDDGAGMAAEIAERVFEPFFTTKDIGEGTGLGLSVSYGIVTDHDGWIALESAPGKGSCFSVFLPLAASR